MRITPLHQVYSPIFIGYDLACKTTSTQCFHERIGADAAGNFSLAFSSCPLLRHGCPHPEAAPPNGAQSSNRRLSVGRGPLGVGNCCGNLPGVSSRPRPPWRGSPFGRSDTQRRTPETAEEYLTTCPSQWVRRKCAAKLAEAEYSRGLLFDTEAAARERATVVAERQARAVRQHARREAEQLAETTKAAAESRTAAEKERLMMRYQGAGLIQE